MKYTIANMSKNPPPPFPVSRTCALLTTSSDDGSDRGDHETSPPHLNDNNGQVQETETETGKNMPTLPRSSSPPAAARPLRYWVRRIHLFLLSIRELKAVPNRGDDCLERVMLETSPRRYRGRGRSRSPSCPPAGARRPSCSPP